MSWGPSHQQARRGPVRAVRWAVAVVVVIVLLSSTGASLDAIVGLFVVVAVAVGVWRAVGLVRGGVSAGQPALVWPRSAQARLAALRDRGAGVYLGVDRRGAPRRARAQRAVLVLGPPRSGKTSSVIIPTVLVHPGAVVSASTKPEVMHATCAARSELGRVWQFDPTGTARPVPGVEVLRWSPVLCSTEWDGALLMARAMVSGAGTGTGTTDATHWTRRAQALLAPLLHAAALGGREMSDVVDWVLRHETDEPGALLEQHGGVSLAAGQLVGLQNTEGRERSSIFSAAADALDAYTSQAALDVARQPNFFAERFVRSADTVYIHAPAEHQHLAAPLVCGLLAEIRRATYAHHRETPATAPVLFALDEVANIAPLAELPQMASEGGGQGLLLLAALQDLSQARARWGTAADGFLTLFGTKLILPGIADHQTLETVSAVIGEYDRQLVSHTSARVGVIGSVIGGRSIPPPSRTTSTQRTRVLSPGEIANIPAGRGLHLDGVRWELVALTPAHATEPWRTLTTPAAR